MEQKTKQKEHKETMRAQDLLKKGILELDVETRKALMWVKMAEMRLQKLTGEDVQQDISRLFRELIESHAEGLNTDIDDEANKQVLGMSEEEYQKFLEKKAKLLYLDF